MKQLYILFFVASMVFMGCSPDTDEVNSEVNLTRTPTLPGGGLEDEVDNQEVGIDESTPLIAGQTINVGTVTVIQDGDTVIVTYETTGDWEIEETHLFVGDLADLPTNGGGNPKIGQFPYKDNHPSGTTIVSYTTIEVLEGECVYIAAHAVVENSSTGQEETAWGEGESIGGSNWSMMFEVCN